MRDSHGMVWSAKLARAGFRHFYQALFVGFLFALLPVSASAQGKWVKPEKHPGGNIAEATADRIILRAMKQKQFPALVLGVVKDGQVVVKKGYGIKSFASEEVPDENTVFYIGSLSKALTAVGAMWLVEQGKLDLDAPAGKYLKGLPNTWRSITVKQFMAHQSGIPQLNSKFPTFKEMLKSAETVPLNFAPGTKQEYNNFNFAVTGKIIEAASGTKYLKFMKQNVFGPLHMDHTGFDISGRNEATGYRPNKGNIRPIKHQMKGGPYAIPSGHLQSTLADLLKFYDALQTGKLLKPATFQQMVTRINLSLSGTPGWFERKAGGDSVVTKNGAVPGFHSIMSFVPGKGDAVVILWTSQKPKANGLFKATNQLLNKICNVPLPGQAEPTDDTPQE
ncbi:MAG: serine hydrolase domain-containing protein [Desulfomonilaceae bacterium]